MGNQFPDFGLRDFFDLIFCVLTRHPRADIEQNTEQNGTVRFCSWFLGINSRLVDLENFSTHSFVLSHHQRIQVMRAMLIRAAVSAIKQHSA